MSKELIAAVSSAVLFIVAIPVGANIWAFDPVPAASLLFPFVVFDYNNPTAGMNTVINITNTAPEAQIVKVELWSDYSFPIVGFNIVLSGYDTQVFQARDILHYGQLPVTGTAGALIVDGPLPVDDGPVSGIDAPWIGGVMPDPDGTSTLASTRCPPTSPAYPGNYASGLSASGLATIEFYLTASQAGARMHDDCFGNTYFLPEPDWWELHDTSQPTWFYITADVVWECNNLFPDQPTYWASQAMYENVLIGQVFWIYMEDGEEQFLSGNAVHIEADLQIGSVGTLDGMGNPITHYYRYSTRNFVASDYREPLPTSWIVPYYGVGGSAMTYLRAWKGSTFYADTIDLYVPGGYTGTYLAYDCWPYTYYAWDEDEMVVTSLPGPPPPVLGPNLLPLGTQEIPVDELNLAASSGWLLFVWPSSNYNLSGAPPEPDYYQTWMGARHDIITATGTASTAMDGIVAANFNCFSDQVLPELGIDYDYVGVTGYNTSPPGLVK